MYSRASVQAMNAATMAIVVRPDSEGALCDHFRDDSILSADYPQEVTGTGRQLYEQLR